MKIEDLKNDLIAYVRVEKEAANDVNGQMRLIGAMYGLKQVVGILYFYDYLSFNGKQEIIEKIEEIINEI